MNALDVDFERDVPTTQEDIEALRRARLLPKLPDDVYLRWLSQLSMHRPPRHEPPPSAPPFTLPEPR
jgi:hypothetical protein